MDWHTLKEEDVLKQLKTSRKGLAEEEQDISPPNIPPNVLVEGYIIKPQEEKRFVDITHDGTGKIGEVYYNPRTKQYEFEPIENF